MTPDSLVNSLVSISRSIDRSHCLNRRTIAANLELLLAYINRYASGGTAIANVKNGDLQINNLDHDLVEKLIEIVTEKANIDNSALASEFTNKLPKVRGLIRLINEKQGNLNDSDYDNFIKDLQVKNVDYRDLKADFIVEPDATSILETLTSLKQSLEKQKAELPNVEMLIDNTLEKFTNPELLHENLHDPLLIEAIRATPRTRWFVDTLKGNKYVVIPRGQGPYPDRPGPASYRILDAEAEREIATKALNTLKANVEEAERTGNFLLTGEQAQEILKGPKKIRMRGAIPELAARDKYSEIVNSLKRDIQDLEQISGSYVVNPKFDAYLQKHVKFNSVFFEGGVLQEADGNQIIVQGLKNKTKDAIREAATDNPTGFTSRVFSDDAIPEIDAEIQSAKDTPVGDPRDPATRFWSVAEKNKVIKDLEEKRKFFLQIKAKIKPLGKTFKNGYSLVDPSDSNPQLGFNEFKKFIKYILSKEKLIELNNLQISLTSYENLLSDVQAKIETGGLEYQTPVINRDRVNSSLLDWEEYIRELDTNSRYQWVTV